MSSPSLMRMKSQLQDNNISRTGSKRTQRMDDHASQEMRFIVLAKRGLTCILTVTRIATPLKQCISISQKRKWKFISLTFNVRETGRGMRLRREIKEETGIYTPFIPSLNRPKPKPPNLDWILPFAFVLKPQGKKKKKSSCMAYHLFN